MTAKQLERRAVAAHRAGDTWNQFWERHGAEVCAAEPHNHQRFGRLVRCLLPLVASGDTDGMTAVGDDGTIAWEIDDNAAKPADAGNAARIDWTAAGVAIPTATTATTH
jgi:hypothetical protein